MSSPVLHVLAGPNGAGKSTFVQAVLQPVTQLPFINADETAAQRWPGQEAEHAYEASAAAMAALDDALSRRRSFITETVFSHPSKGELIQQGIFAGYLVTMDVILVPEDVAVMRVEYRVAQGGHTVPETKVRERYRRLWDLVAEARGLADRCTVYDNSRASTPFLPIANYEKRSSHWWSGVAGMGTIRTHRTLVALLTKIRCMGPVVLNRTTCRQDHAQRRHGVPLSVPLPVYFSAISWVLLIRMAAALFWPSVGYCHWVTTPAIARPTT